MTTSTHVYRAYLIGTPDVELSRITGSLTLDPDGAPHVEGQIECAVSDPAILAALDPTRGARVRVEVDGTYPAFSIHRDFDLSLRERPSQITRSRVQLELASDEALLLDYLSLTDDNTPRQFEASLRNVTNYTLAKALGATSPQTFTAPTSTVGWTYNADAGAGVVSRLAASNAPGTTALRAAYTSGAATYFGLATNVAGQQFPVTPGRTYSARARMRSNTTRDLRFRIEWRTAANTFLSAGTYQVATPGANVWADFHVTETAPATAAWGYIVARVFGTPTAGNAMDVAGYTAGPGLFAPQQLAPGVDADITRYWTLTNRVYNPSAETTTGYALGGNASGLGTGTSSPYHGGAYVRWTATAVGLTSLVVTADGEYTPLTPMTATVQLRANGTSATGQVLIRFYNSNGDVLADATSPAVPLSVTTAWTEVSFTATGPRGTTRAALIVLGTATSAGQVFAIDGVMFHDGDERVPFFTGSSMMPGATGYTTAWNGAASNSASTRTPYPIARSKESLTWPAGVAALDFLHPLLQAQGLRLVCDETRTWTLRNDAYTATGDVAIRYAVDMIDGTDTIAVEDQYTYDAAVAVYTWTDRYGVELREIDSYALTTPYVAARRFDFEDTPFPGPGFAQYAVTRAQNRGRRVEATAVADWRAKPEQLATFTTAEAPTLVGKSGRVQFDLDTDRMTVGAVASPVDPLAWSVQTDTTTWLAVSDTSTWN